MFLLVFFICLLQIISLCFPNYSFAQVVISEVYPQPSSDEGEWVEIINLGTNAVDLSGWFLQDKLSTPKDIYSFSDISLEPQVVFVATVSSSLNNSSDGVTLFNSLGESISTMNYESTQAGLSWTYDFIQSKFWETQPTLGTVDFNQGGVTVPPSPAGSPLISPTPVMIQDISGKIELRAVLSCPSDGYEWLEIENISVEQISQTIYVSDNQGNIISLDLDIDALNSQRYFLDRHIINNSGDKLSFYQSSNNEDLLGQYYIPECENKDIPFINVSGQLLIDDSFGEGLSEENFSTEEKNKADDQNSTKKVELPGESFELGSDYLQRLHYLEAVDYDEKLVMSSESAQANFIENKKSNHTFFTRKSLIFPLAVILVSITLSIFCIMYLYGKTKKEDSGLD